MIMRTLFIFVGDGGKYGKNRQVLYSQAQFSDVISSVLFLSILHSSFLVLTHPCVTILIVLSGHFLIILLSPF